MYKIFGDNILYYRNEEEFRQCILKLEDNYPEIKKNTLSMWDMICLLYTSDAADDLLCVNLGGCPTIKKKKKPKHTLDVG